MTHRLDPLLRPRSVAVVGASAREDSLGDWALRNLVKGGFGGAIYPVNPRYETLQGLRCYATLAALPETPDLVVFAVADHRLEAAVDEAIAAGVRAAVIQSPLVIDDDAEPPLKARLAQKIRTSGLLVCGANCMGYYNVRDHVWTCGFDSTMHEAPGSIALITHSGSGMSGIIDCDARIRINVAISAGNEIGVTMDEYLDFVLDLPETRVVGLFVETARNPAGFRAALARANERGIPVVALKVGRTAEAAALALSHSGAMAGDDATYEALFDRYGVLRARDQDELATMLVLFADCHPVGDGGLVTLHDSGGERQLMVDLARDARVPLTRLSEESVAELESVLDPELPAVNPLDAWSRGGPDAAEIMTRCLEIMMRDPGAAMGAVIHDRAPGGGIYASYVDYMRRARAASGKPVALVAARQGTGHDPRVVATTREGLPVLDGVSPFLAGVRALFEYRDFCGRRTEAPREAPRDIVAEWHMRLHDGGALSEYESLRLLADFGIPVANPVPAASEDEVLDAAAAIGYPVALKSAQEGLLHKSDAGGVVVGIGEDEQLVQRYRVMSSDLGSAVLVAPMIAAGVELFLGVKRDPQFGPVVLIGFGGVLAETILDVAFALPPFDAAHARRLLGGMKLRPLLDGVRGGPPVAIEAFCEAAARFSEMAHAPGDLLAEVDVNPVIVNEDGAVAVDALVVGGP